MGELISGEGMAVAEDDEGVVGSGDSLTASPDAAADMGDAVADTSFPHLENKVLFMNHRDYSAQQLSLPFNVLNIVVASVVGFAAFCACLRRFGCCRQVSYRCFLKVDVRIVSMSTYYHPNICILPFPGPLRWACAGALGCRSPLALSA